MTPEDIARARDEAIRFTARTEAALAAFEKRNSRDGSRTYFVNNDTKSTAALKRSSMDLTRALADLRKPS